MTRNRFRFLIPLALAGLVATSCASDTGEGDAPAGNYPRAETLYTGGTQWGPPISWNPLDTGSYATGTVGLVYETLFLYEPQSGEYIPWLAESGEWTDDSTYELKLREGVEWSDGEAFTADDVVFTVEVGQIETSSYSNLWQWLESAEAVDDHTVEFTFSEANYAQWANWLYFNAIVPEHLWADRSDEEIITGANEDPVGTGAYAYETHDQDRQVWRKREDWWATEALDREVAPTYIVDVVNTSNEAALGQVLQGNIDMNNNFLPGVAQLVQGGYGVETYYPEEPYMLSANTAWLVPNTTREPMNDPEFRKALSASIDMDEIVNGVYGGIVTPADPTGLLPAWDDYIDTEVVEEYATPFDTDEAKSILEEAGYEDTDNDGLVETPNGDPIELSLIVPSGWTDWMEAARVISESATAAGINVTAEFPEFNALVDQRNSGDFDLVINNERQISNTPWTYYDYMFRLPVQESQTTVNFGRYENEEVWELVGELDRTPVEDTEAILEITGRLQQIHLEEMPIIPLWYNGLWSQTSNTVWTNWPSSETDNHYLPSTWRGYFQLGGILMLTELEPATGE
ncbi:ABC transporter substrate-binding protein [Actinorugispora endophytica]|uniref:Peptide/nickel transport system substrate-binding protein n=1 Tax=Actinorugispora endophytica TaxID=1605990 RepID=A0A4R6V127_9ACTN|nr:ABC transporter substrate-binding protein [Actinorugispora endophytica]TDQ52368.1 peptide/nickel transport system substrate-binding protein [Actinorugispora endophytica]